MSFSFDVRYSEERNGVRRPGAVGAIRHYLNSLADLFRTPEPIMKEIGEHLVMSTKRRFNIEMSPNDGRWARNSPVTIARKGSAKPLTHTGKLRDSIEYKLLGSKKAVSVGSNRVQAAMMQFGGTKARYPHLWGDIPARPFLGRSKADEEKIAEIIRRWIGQA